MPITATSDLAPEVWSSRAEIEQMFGAVSVERWADIAGSKNQAAISKTIHDAALYATELVRSRLRGTIATNASGTSLVLRRIVTTLAGDQLYSSRGIQDGSEDDGRNRLTSLVSRANKMLQQIVSGVIRLDAEITQNIPLIVDLTEEETFSEDRF